MQCEFPIKNKGFVINKKNFKSVQNKNGFSLKNQQNSSKLIQFEAGAKYMICKLTAMN
jgi:hypothetical protein